MNLRERVSLAALLRDTLRQTFDRRNSWALQFGYGLVTTS